MASQCVGTSPQLGRISSRRSCHSDCVFASETIPLLRLSHSIFNLLSLPFQAMNRTADPVNGLLDPHVVDIMYMQVLEHEIYCGKWTVQTGDGRWHDFITEDQLLGQVNVSLLNGVMAALC